MSNSLSSLLNQIASVDTTVAIKEEADRLASLIQEYYVIDCLVSEISKEYSSDWPIDVDKIWQEVENQSISLEKIKRYNDRMSEHMNQLKAYMNQITKTEATQLMGIKDILTEMGISANRDFDQALRKQDELTELAKSKDVKNIRIKVVDAHSKYLSHKKRLIGLFLRKVPQLSEEMAMKVLMGEPICISSINKKDIVNLKESDLGPHIILKFRYRENTDQNRSSES